MLLLIFYAAPETSHCEEKPETVNVSQLFYIQRNVGNQLFNLLQLLTLRKQSDTLVHIEFPLTILCKQYWHKYGPFYDDDLWCCLKSHTLIRLVSVKYISKDFSPWIQLIGHCTNTPRAGR